jgi:hypothetical protein
MQDDRWREIIEMAKSNFQSVSLQTEDIVAETPDGPQKQGTRDVLIFSNPAGKFKLVRENRPVVLEKKEFYSHRAGQAARTEYKLSETEFSHKVRVFREVSFDEWDEITLDKMGL